jgi:hypothetical protein
MDPATTVRVPDEPSFYADDPWKSRGLLFALQKPPARAFGHRKLDSLPRLTTNGAEGAAGRSIVFGPR